MYAIGGRTTSCNMKSDTQVLVEVQGLGGVLFVLAGVLLVPAARDVGELCRESSLLKSASATYLVRISAPREYPTAKTGASGNFLQVECSDFVFETK